jgi:hypothetical protein
MRTAMVLILALAVGACSTGAKSPAQSGAAGDRSRGRSRALRAPVAAIYLASTI